MSVGKMKLDSGAPGPPPSHLISTISTCDRKWCQILLLT